MPDHETDSLIGSGIRQGAILPCSDLSSELKSRIQQCRAVTEARDEIVDDDQLLLVLSQDCDIANGNEQHLEVLTMRRVTRKELKGAASVRGARNTRKLHLPVDGEYWRCDVNQISLIPKAEFSEGAGLNNLDYLSDQSRDVMLTWRINRYTRIPLPDAFNHDLLFNYLHKAENGFEDFLQENRERIVDIYVSISPGEEGADEYAVSITALLSENCSRQDADEIKDVLKAHMVNLHDQNNRLRMMQIDPDYIPEEINHTLDIVAFPQDFTMQDIQAMKRLTIDYLCFPTGE